MLPVQGPNVEATAESFGKLGTACMIDIAIGTGDNKNHWIKRPMHVLWEADSLARICEARATIDEQRWANNRKTWTLDLDILLIHSKPSYCIVKTCCLHWPTLLNRVILLPVISLFE